MGYVYLLLEIDDLGNERHKIGFTKNPPEQRLRQLKTGNPNQVRVLNSYISPNYVKVEAMLHKRYQAQRTEAKNEWFHLTDEQVLRFLDTCKEADDLISFMVKNNTFYL
jgi:hypothetical protein